MADASDDDLFKCLEAMALKCAQKTRLEVHAFLDAVVTPESASARVRRWTALRIVLFEEYVPLRDLLTPLENQCCRAKELADQGTGTISEWLDLRERSLRAKERYAFLHMALVRMPSGDGAELTFPDPSKLALDRLLLLY